MAIHLNWLDSILLIILLITFLFGLVKGFFRQIIGILAIVAGVILASRYYVRLSVKFYNLIDSDFWRNCLSFLLIFFGVLLVGWLLGFIIGKLMKGSLSLTNHLLGGGLGLLKGILIGTVIVFAMLSFNFQRQALIESKLAPAMLKISKGLLELVPDDFKNHFREALKKFEGKGNWYEQKI
ncbi:MAG: CvpA family protein [Acidobacteriota bacterium]|nr:CvpA family protein [Acidobacteriota bacterium]MDW3229698.1 CvpA family protein [Acidobacteriota bacterium]